MLDKFYAVTLTSVYVVEAHGPWRASAIKIAQKDESKNPVGFDLAKGNGMIAICDVLQAFVPEKYGMAHPMTGFERRLEYVNTTYWGGHSSSIVALFKSEGAATACFNSTDQLKCDLRWRDSTRQVLAEIGEEHPSFYICHFDNRELLPRETA